MDGDDVKENDVPATATSTAKHLRAVPPPTQTVAAGDLETLFRDHHEQIFRTAYRITGSAVDAEDVLQTIFLRLASSKERRDLSPSPGSYLHRAAVNAALDLMRGRTRARAVSIESVEPTREFISSDLNPEEAHAENQLRARVREAVARLGGRAATTFALRYFEGYDNREIAEMLGTSQMVVAVTLHRARTRLRKEIGEYLERGNHEA
ncbi:MAG TPA: sigma-70 family RNA polymerase sigma factor [Pyrinomonadaceae bacterium]|nr:sigma-70 family RNA polymerase sigma factor [Pyrinomonadaceae bacterium]